MEEKEEKKDEISFVQTVFMVTVAIIFDVVQALIELIPILGQIISIFIDIAAFFTFYLWFKMNGMNFSDPKKAGIMGGGFLIELIPILNALPAWTLAVVLLIGTTKAKELVAQNIPGGAGGALGAVAGKALGGDTQEPATRRQTGNVRQTPPLQTKNYQNVANKYDGQTDKNPRVGNFPQNTEFISGQLRKTETETGDNLEKVA
ncbi:MAG: hypothetical protein WCK48_02125 [bacterium]